MSFENIKVGDKVLAPRFVDYGWRGKRHFYVISEVAKTTKTQFTTDTGDRFKKEYGRPIGGSCISCAKKIDSKDHKDQTEEFEWFKRKVDLEIAFCDKLSSLNLELSSPLNMDQLGIINSAANTIKRVLDTIKKSEK